MKLPDAEHKEFGLLIASVRRRAKLKQYKVGRELGLDMGKIERTGQAKLDQLSIVVTHLQPHMDPIERSRSLHFLDRLAAPVEGPGQDWKSCPKAPHILVAPDGQIWNSERQRMINARDIAVNGKKMSRPKVVLETFVGPPLPGQVVLFEDGDTSNCRADNLRWAGAHDAAVRHQRTAIKNRTDKGLSARANSPLTVEDIEAIYTEPHAPNVVRKLARKYKINVTAIQRIRNDGAYLDITKDLKGGHVPHSLRAEGKPDPQYYQLNIRITEAQHFMLAGLADKAGLTLSAFSRMAMMWSLGVDSAVPWGHRQGKRLRLLRLSRGIDQIDLSRAHRMSHNYLSSLENGGHRTTDGRLLKSIAMSLGCVPSFLCDPDLTLPRAMRVLLDAREIPA
jgi:DNA-binding Xre family transcriptional regulator